MSDSWHELSEAEIEESVQAVQEHLLPVLPLPVRRAAARFGYDQPRECAGKRVYVNERDYCVVGELLLALGDPIAPIPQADEAVVALVPFDGPSDRQQRERLMLGFAALIELNDAGLLETSASASRILGVLW